MVSIGHRCCGLGIGPGCWHLHGSRGRLEENRKIFPPAVHIFVFPEYIVVYVIKISSRRVPGCDIPLGGAIPIIVGLGLVVVSSICFYNQENVSILANIRIVCLDR
jgi:hypothetical protein